MTRNASSAALTTMRIPSLRPLWPRLRRALPAPEPPSRHSPHVTGCVIRSRTAGPVVPDGKIPPMAGRRPATRTSSPPMTGSRWPRRSPHPSTMPQRCSSYTASAAPRRTSRDHVDAPRRVTIGSSRSTTAGTARATPPTIRRAYSLDRLAADVAGGGRLRSSCDDLPAARALDGRHGDAPGRARPPRPPRRARVHGHVGGPAARHRHRARRASAAGVAMENGMAVLRRLLDELDLLGSAAYQRVARGTAGLPRVRRLQVVDAVAGDVDDARA